MLPRREVEAALLRRAEGLFKGLPEALVHLVCVLVVVEALLVVLADALLCGLREPEGGIGQAAPKQFPARLHQFTRPCTL